MMASTAIKWCLLLIITASVLFPAVAYIGVIAALMLAVKARKSRQLIGVIKKDSSILIVLISIAVSAVYSKAMLLSLGAVILIALNLTFLLILVVEARSTGWEKYYRLINLLSVLLSLYGLYQFLTGSLDMNKSWVDVNTYGILPRVYSTLSNPNIFAGYLMINLSFAVPRYKGFKNNPLLTVNIILSSLCILLTYSRGGFAGLFISMLAIFLLNRNKRVLIYLCAMAALFIAVNTTGGISRADISSIHMDSSSQYRILIWKSAVNMFLDRPVLGNGVGTAWYYLSSGSDKLYGYVLHSHNIFLQVAAEMGIVGLLSSVYFIVSNMLEGLRMLTLIEGTEEACILQGFIACMAGIVFHGLVDAVAFLPNLSIIIMIYYGVYKAALEKVQCSVEKSDSGFYGQRVSELFGCEGSRKYKCYEKENEAC